MLKKILFLIFLFSSINLFSQTYNLDSLSDLSFEDLIEFQLKIASVKQRSIQESPSVITLITKEEIENSGARNIVDILNLVPGFNFVHGSVGSVSLAIRGMAAAEGKVLFMLNGMILNDPIYGSFTLENRIVPEQISRIEIIRGPGSAKYGGYAGLSVINIITNKPENEAFEINFMHGAMSGELNSLNNVNLSYRKKIKDLGLSISMAAKQGDISSIYDFEDYFKQKRSMKDASKYFGINADILLNYKNLETTFSYGEYDYDNISNIGMAGLSGNVILNRRFDHFLSSAKYKLKLNENLIVSPKISYNYFIPYHLTARDGDETVLKNGDFYKLNAIRICLSTEVLYTPNENLNIMFGVENTSLKAEAKSLYIAFAPEIGNTADTYFDGKKNISLNSFGFYSQMDFFSSIINVTAGLRYDQHELAGKILVPRMALTKKIGKFHAKLLYGMAYRLPDIANITAAVKTENNGNIVINTDNGEIIKGNLHPEKIFSNELEFGFQTAKTLSININFFINQINDPVIYRFVNGLDTYSNFGDIRTEGVETSLFFKNKILDFKFNYSFYKVNKNTISLYKVDNDDDILIGIPAHKINLISSLKIFSNKIIITPSINYYSERHTAYREEGITLFSEKLESIIIANLFINFKLNNKITIGAGVYDILDSKFKYAAEIENLHAPLPTRSREFLIKLKYNIND